MWINHLIGTHVLRCQVKILQNPLRTTIKIYSKVTPPNTVMSIISAITKEFDKPISALSFSDDCAQVSIKFADGSSIVALTPDLTSSTENEIPVTDVDSTSPLIFTSLRSNSEDGTETFTLHANNKSLARQGFSEAIIKRAQEKG
uniref:Uncharacterized protein n=1 Tax=Ciona savignyi TaxID=51511 RepID=H2Y9K7_CIOSA